jgi:hypothetical protein
MTTTPLVQHFPILRERGDQRILSVEAWGHIER